MHRGFCILFWKLENSDTAVYALRFLRSVENVELGARERQKGLQETHVNHSSRQD